MKLNYLALRVRWLVALAVVVGALAVVPAAAAPPAMAGPPYPDAEWAAWGLAASFTTGAPRVSFAAYVGKRDTQPQTPGDQPGVLGSLVTEITADCRVRGAPALAVDAAGYADFDGGVYLECRTPDWRLMVAQLAPHLNVANGPATECPADRSPVWAAAELILDPVATGVARQNPLLDASALGLTFSLPTSGSIARARIGLSSGDYQSTAWAYDSVGGNRLLLGRHGAADVASIQHFGGLAYMQNPGWANYFNTTVSADRVGQWLEPANGGTYTTAALTGPFIVATGSQTVYIGRDNQTGAMLEARVRKIQSDPGCYGD